MKALIFFLLLALPCAAQTHPPVLVRHPDFPYPMEARHSLIQDDGNCLYIYPEGRVVVQFTVTAKGKITKRKVVKSGGKYFDTAALNAVDTWKYEPAMKDGVPCEEKLVVEVYWQKSVVNAGK
jgi:TonB family protein